MGKAQCPDGQAYASRRKAAWLEPLVRLSTRLSPGLEIARNLDQCGVARIRLRCLSQVTSVEPQLIHDAQNVVIGLAHVRGFEVLAYFAEHVASFELDRAHSEVVRVCFSAFARKTQFFRRPHAEKLVA